MEGAADEMGWRPATSEPKRVPFSWAAGEQVFKRHGAPATPVTEGMASSMRDNDEVPGLERHEALLPRRGQWRGPRAGEAGGRRGGRAEGRWPRRRGDAPPKTP